MRLLLEFDDSKADFVKELLANLSFIKTRDLTPNHGNDQSEYKAEVLGGIRKGIEELNLAKEGKLEGMSMEEFLESV
jgi:hypothetical protein